MQIPEICLGYGEGNLDAVDIIVGNNGNLDMQGGTMKNFLLSGTKAGQLVVQDGYPGIV